MRRLLLVLPIVAATACKSHQPPPTASACASAGTATRDTTTAAAAAPSASGAHALDPHALSQAELRYGVSPTKDSAVTYQDNVVLMEHGADAIKSVSPDGLTWTIDASSLSDHPDRATRGTNVSRPGGGNATVRPCSALMYPAMSSFTTSTPSSNVNAGASPRKNARTMCRFSASYP